MSVPKELLERSKQFEKKWDRRFGGRGTRAYRELFGFVAGRLLGFGTDPADLVAYFHELVSMLSEMIERDQLRARIEYDPGKGGSA